MNTTNTRLGRGAHQQQVSSALPWKLPPAEHAALSYQAAPASISSSSPKHPTSNSKALVKMMKAIGIHVQIF
jgi:hypothetical protein